MDTTGWSPAPHGTLRPHLEGHLKGTGSSLKAFVRSLEAQADAHMAARAARLSA